MGNKSVSSAIAVIGMACRYPGANDLRTFWENILARRRQFRSFPDQRFPLDDYYDPDPSAPDKTYCNKAALTDGFNFDWISHRIPKSSFLSADIVHWLALDVALQAVADAGFIDKIFPHERSGVILGNSLTGEQTRSEGLRLRWPFVARSLKTAAKARGLSANTVTELLGTMEQYYKSVFAPITEDTLAGALSNTIAGRICNYLDFHGGGYTVDGACSSGLVAIATASSALMNRDLDLALAGGVDVSLDTLEMIGFAKTGALTKTDMRVYDRRGNGFLPGEGCGFVLLKRLEDAVTDKNYIYAIIQGWGISSDGKGGLTAPSVSGQAAALRRAYDRAGLNPRELDFIEGHGTGTAVGDRVELEAIAEALGDGKEVTKRSCGVTSLKSIIGHTKAASGIGGFIKAAIAVNQRILPPTANCTEPNEVFGNMARSLYPIMTGELRFPSEKLKAGVSAMGFGGINCHVVIESADAPSTKLRPSMEEQKLLVSHQDTELFVLSGASPKDMMERLQALRQHAHGMCAGELVDLAAQLARELDPNTPLRAAITAGAPEKLLEGCRQLEELLGDKSLSTGEKFISPEQDLFLGNMVQESKVGFLFPGQGSQQLNMASAIVKRHAWAQALVAKANRWSGENSAKELTDYIYKAAERALDREQLEDWSARLRDTEIAQPAICLGSLLWAKKLNSLGIKPVAVGGHSLGELTAFHVAGAFDEEALLKLAGLRGEAMGAAGDESGSMASLTCSYDVVMDILSRVEGYAVVANINSPNQVVISGERSVVEKAVNIAAERGLVAHILPVSNAFHSKFILQAAERLRNTKVIPKTLDAGHVKIFSSSDGKQAEPGLKLREHFANQALSQVNFVSLVKALSRECDMLLEVGPGMVLTKLSNSITNGQGPVCLPIESKAGKDSDLNRFLGEYFVQGGTVKWEELYEGRLVRAFIPASKRIFIENPCERPFAIPASEAPQLREAEGQAQKILADSACVSPEIISNYLSRRGHFLGAIIKADLETSDAQHTMKVLPDSHDFSGSEKAVLEKNEAPLVDDAGDATASISRMLLELVEQRTGFPQKSLSMGLRLLNDLNLDSIKAAELIAAAAMRLKVAGSLNTAQFANATLSEIADTLASLVDKGKVVKLQAGNMQEPVSPGRQEKARVRNFVVHYVPESLPSSDKKRRDTAWEQAVVLIMSDKTESALAMVLKRELMEKGAQAQIVYFPEAPLGLENKNTLFTHYITILPRTPNYGLSHPARLQAMVKRLRTAVILHSAAKARHPDVTMAYIQFGRGHFGTEMKHGDIEQCCATAFAASVHHEHPELKVRVLDFAPRISQAVVSQYVVQELSTPERYSAVGYDSKMIRRVPRPRILEPASYGKRTITWSSDDVVLVTGGAKGITAECALAFARATGARMALVGSSPHPDENPGNNGSLDIVRILERASAEGLSCRYYSCDITDAASLNLLIQQVRNELGHITGVIHGAGLNMPNRAENVSSEDALKEIGPKLHGAINLCDALKDAPPKLFVGITSVIGVTGMPGNAWYAFSNEALDVVLRRFEKDNPASSVLCIAYSIWEKVGMGARMGSVQHLAKMGIGAIPTSEGTQRFLDLALNKPEARQVIVTARLGGLDTWTPAKHTIHASRFLEDIITIEPNVEVVSRARLSLEKDPYIKDHMWRGTYLFPAVFGLEAMSQAVAYVTGRNNFTTLHIEDIRLDRPIAVFPDAGCIIEIHAEVLERESVGAPQRVSVVVRSEQTGFSTNHFAATFILDNKTEPRVEHVDLPKNPLDIEPKRDLYNGLLFQGPLFQRIQQVYSLNSKKCVFQTELRPDTDMPENIKTSSWIMGDPFFRDSLLHAPQLPLAQDICLPLRIGRLERFNNGGRTPKSLIGVAVIEGLIGNEVTATVYTVDKSGHVVERLTGYILKVMEHHKDYPTAEEIADPGKRDENIMHTGVAERSRQLNMRVPEISSVHIPGIHQLPKTERRKQELPFIQDSVRRAQKNNGYVTDEVGITWLESGKPRFEDAIAGLDISLSHDKGTVLCVAGSGPQGCDLVSVSKRSREEWIALLEKTMEPLFQQLIDSIDSQERSGTRIWAAIEAAYKATASFTTDLTIERQSEDTVLFRCNFPDKDLFILTFPVTLTRGPERILALVVQPIRDRLSTVQKTHKNVHSENLNYDFNSHMVEIIDGPQGQPLFIFQFPVTFKEVSNPSRTLYFSHYFTWMGKLREFAIQPIYNNLVELFSTGKWGMVTNHAETNVLGDAQSGDIIEGRVWVDKVTGKDSSEVDICFEWWKKTLDGRRKQIAFSTMSTTWVAIHGHGVVEVHPFPEVIKEFFDKLLPPINDREIRYRTSEPEPSFDFGQELYREPVGPVQPTALLKERIFETTLEDANLVGNIYFSNYYLWQGRVRDYYINEIAPEYFSGTEKRGELRCIRCKINHINEAMPFDRIAVRMYRTAIFEHGVKFYFDYYRAGLDGDHKKLGYGEHEAVWYTPTEDNTWTPSELPQIIRDALLPRQTPVGLVSSPVQQSLMRKV